MRIAGALQVLLCCSLLLAWPGQGVQAGQVLTTIHKASPGAAAVAQGSNGSVSSAPTSSRVVLCPDDVELVKSPPGGGGRAGLNRDAALLEQRITARSAVVVDPTTGRLLFALNPDQPRQPASTIKIVTALIAMQSLRDQELVSTSARAARMPRSKIYLQAGRSYRAGDLINATLLSSANDASVALAERIAGSEAAFARLMTSKARAMGATNTVIHNSNGLTARGQQSTARDLAIILHRSMQNPEFARRLGTTSASTNFGQTLRTNNRALWQINGAEGGKTGFTRAARQTYVGKFKRGNQELIVALMGSDTMWEDVGQLVEYGFRQLRDGTMVAAAPVDAAFTQRGPAGGSVASLTILSNAAKSGL
ncbi:D-alanyl-D-alanine carboxypeptidase family protein [Desulfurivibrio alkaliphilus]|uniref:Peptidase S11 D-alanyl-D-alanine carboxypeptidase 1 n=1 Tax=Desulfurivibrio alkaliphilus (strain DSM 19089 / UNIQEM U267 / AHT2) TaxID=589865 RepID=D6Z495_DESAT|nr:D-alanyl-D-alanine carboxypeptidase family protein [Desulfurivibrio alkaliphilus]ADH86370.1 peptidase S11 D-alanyl-D-alanine carboxypeptidase 1 [Desulfurivibrio alkaliphilus AHT 2]